MADYSSINNYQSLADLLKPKEEEQLFSPADQLMSPINPTPEQLAALTQQQAPEPEIEQPVMKAAPAAPKQEQGVQPKNSDMQNAMNALENWQNRPKEASQSLDQSTAAAPDKPLSKLDQLEAMMKELQTTSSKDLEEARKSDRMLKIGGALGDALATYLNAQGQMNVKAPGVQVQQGAGLGKVADMFATAPEIQSDIKSRSEALMKQYGELAKGERAQARLTSEAEMAKNRMAQQERLTQAEIDARLEAARIGSSKKDEALNLRKQQYAQLGEGQVEKLSVLKESIDESNALLPQLDKARKSLGIINTPISDIEAKFGKNPEYQTLKQNYSSIRNSIRKAIFGATLTPGEQEEFDNELSKLSISDKNLEGSINNLIGRLKSKARSRLNTIAQTQPLKAETAMNAVKTFGLEESQKVQDTFPKILYKINPQNPKKKITATVKDEKELKEAMSEGFQE